MKPAILNASLALASIPQSVRLEDIALARREAELLIALADAGHADAGLSRVLASAMGAQQVLIVDDRPQDDFFDLAAVCPPDFLPLALSRGSFGTPSVSEAFSTRYTPETTAATEEKMRLAREADSRRRMAKSEAYKARKAAR